MLDGLPGGRGLNIAHEAVDRHAGGRGEHLALRWLGKDGAAPDFSYRELRPRPTASPMSCRARRRSGRPRLHPAGRVPELYVAALGALKNRSVFSPLFSAFGPEPIAPAWRSGRRRVLVTNEALYRRKVAPWRTACPDLAHVLLIGGATAVPETLLGCADRGGRGRFEIAADRSRGHGAAAFHQRHHGQARRARCTSTRPSGALRDRQVRPRSASRRHLLVHRGSGLGDRNVLRHLRAA